MRPIKYRVWDKEEKKMYQNDQLFGSDLAAALYATGAVGGRGDIEVLQYTGIHDEKKVDIYEGDVVSSGIYPNATVKWCNEENLQASFCLALNEDFVDDDPDEPYTIEKGKHIEVPYYEIKEVLGNIYENPELVDN